MCEPRQRTPGAADRVEIAAPAGLELRRTGYLVAHDAIGALQRLVRHVLQGKAAERQRHAGADAMTGHIDEFQRAAAEIADEAIGALDAGDDAQRRQMRFLRAGQHANGNTADALGAFDEMQVRCRLRGRRPSPRR